MADLAQPDVPAQAEHKQKPRKTHLKKPIPPRTPRFDFPLATPEYFEENGLRKVKPYMFTFESWSKERWHGRTLIDIYGEFKDRSTEYYEWAIKTGAIVVNNAPSTKDTIIRNGDLICNVLHRHEPPVVAGPIKILYDGRLPGNDGETLVVEKPGSMPVHPTGRYTFNTLLEILKYDYDLPLVHTSNRLDRLTSGVMVCSLTSEGSKKLGAWFGGKRADEGGVHKEYVARCKGFFPDGEIVCEEPMLTIDRQIGVNVVHPDGRDAKTVFQRLTYHAKTDTSVVHCTPITGRSHQIRVHLQYIGYPIANDPIYANPAAWGPSGGKGGVFPNSPDPEDASPTQETREPDELLNEAGDTNQALDTAEVISSASPPPRTTTVNRSGHLIAAMKAGAQAAGLDADERHAFQIPLSPAARTALCALRADKDAQDGWSRWRDTKGLEKARKAGLDVGEEEEIGKGVPAIEKVNFEGDEPDEAFCKECFVPLVPDPVDPGSLFIWLHAMRYKTTEWDWKSDMPSWAVDLD